MSDVPHVQYGFVQGSTVALGGVDVSYERGNLAQCRGPSIIRSWTRPSEHGSRLVYEIRIGI